MDNLNKHIRNISNAMDLNDPVQVASNLDAILKDYNERVMFKDMKEFDEFFNDENSILKL